MTEEERIVKKVISVNLKLELMWDFILKKGDKANSI